MHTTTAPTDTDRKGRPFTPAQEEQIERFVADLLSGEVFDRHARSDRSRYGYQPPTTRKAWGHAVATLGRMAERGDALAQVAVGILARVPNLYGTDGELAAGIYERAAEAIRAGYDDVLRRSGPEPCRHKDAQRAYTLGEVVTVAYWLIEATGPASSGVVTAGWVLDAIRRAHRVYVNPTAHGWQFLTELPS